MSTNNFSTELEKLPDFAIAYQPIVNVANRTVVAYEALTRGVNGVPYPELIEGMDDSTRRRFHHATAERMLRRAVKLGLLDSGASLCINIEPDIETGSLSADYIREAAVRYGVPCNRIVLELTENHRVKPADLRVLLEQNEAAGFATAMDDFGAGYAGLSMLAECRPQILKLDRALVQGIDHCDTRQKLVHAFARVCKSLGMMVVAEGIETREECLKLRRLGVNYMQGYLFARPCVDELPQPDWDAILGGRRRGQLLPKIGTGIGAWMHRGVFTLPA